MNRAQRRQLIRTMRRKDRERPWAAPGRWTKPSPELRRKRRRAARKRNGRS